MSQLRQDPTSKHWVIIAEERHLRPHDFVRKSLRPVSTAYRADCPFCDGNEHLTPPEVLAFREEGPRDSPGWRVRVVPNKFPALIPQGSLTRSEEHALFRWMDGVGTHEVIIESSLHNLHIPLMKRRQAEEVVLAYRERYLELRKDPRFKLILIFKNYGISAGTSLEHPHSQLVATPIVPTDIREKFEKATEYFDDNGVCVFCRVLEEELKGKRRIIMENDGFVVFHPFASRVPFETWIMPRRHRAAFGLITKEEVRDFAAVLRRVLAKVYHGLSDPDFNFIVHTAPVKDEFEDYFHWHLQIMPRLTTAAGFEMGTGIFINTALPEETAAYMRDFPEK